MCRRFLLFWFLWSRAKRSCTSTSFLPKTTTTKPSGCLADTLASPLLARYALRATILAPMAGKRAATFTKPTRPPTRPSRSLSSFPDLILQTGPRCCPEFPEGCRTNITFAARATNTPTVTIGGTSRTIANLWLDENAVVTRDGLGICVTGTALSYSTGASASWSGAGVINKPIGGFHTGTFNSFGFAHLWFAGSNKAQIVVSSQIIPEPEKYALLFGLFALASVFFHRWRMQKKRRQQSTTASPLPIKR